MENYARASKIPFERTDNNEEPARASKSPLEREGQNLGNYSWFLSSTNLFQTRPTQLKTRMPGVKDSDENCVNILKRCREAIPSKEDGGKVIIIDMVVDGDRDEHNITETKLVFDILMMVLVTGRERSEKEWEKIFLEAGFSHYKITPIFGLRSLIELLMGLTVLFSLEIRGNYVLINDKGCVQIGGGKQKLESNNLNAS
ncbi:hypothetical protein HYC85_017911 [Camellia sinensis]|uniref:O-methyltransferase C-terminal domain-containing protein n=1 Tax=Camellia sinensis TaxID=4442 RepID=A0A7J7GWH6_CAMSI|nr:hypothetical protein HYC85_017911 [Camellia sinensis]